MSKKFVILARRKRQVVLGLCNSLLMGLGQDRQQHLAVHTGGIREGFNKNTNKNT